MVQRTTRSPPNPRQVRQFPRGTTAALYAGPFRVQGILNECFQEGSAAVALFDRYNNIRGPEEARHAGEEHSRTQPNPTILSKVNPSRRMVSITDKPRRSAEGTRFARVRVESFAFLAATYYRPRLRMNVPVEFRSWL